MKSIIIEFSKKIGYVLGILFCLTLSASLVYASYWMIIWNFSEHPDAPIYDNSYSNGGSNTLSYGGSLKTQTDEYCKNHCSEIPNAVSHITQLVEREMYFVCLCYNENHAPIDRTEWTIS